MSGGFVMDGISEQVWRKLEQVFKEATDLAVQTILAGWDRKTPLHFSKIEESARRLAGLWSCHICGVVISKNGPPEN
jgi:hypothetical protein